MAGIADIYRPVVIGLLFCYPLSRACSDFSHVTAPYKLLLYYYYLLLVLLSIRPNNSENFIANFSFAISAMQLIL